MSERSVLRGIGVSVGTAAARVVRLSPAPGVDPSERPSIDPEGDLENVRTALTRVSAALKDRAKKAGEGSAEILMAAAQLAADKGLVKAVDKKLKTGYGPTGAVHAAVDEYAEMLKALGGYMAERATDLYDVRDRAICELRGLPAPGLPNFTEPNIIVAEDLAPAETATLDTSFVKGIVTQAGGPTSHTAIIAAQLGIPAVVQAKGIMEVCTGEVVALDGSSGEVIVCPTDEDVERLEERSRLRAEALACAGGPGVTADGHHVKILANIATVDDAMRAAEKDLEGVGLMRTEFLFIDRAQAPTLDEQIDTYTQVLAAFGTARVVVRTLDAGADKPLSFADLGAEENPALGRRGLRLCQAREDLIDTQLAALAAAGKKTEAELWVMAPMVSTLEETQWFTAKARAAGLEKVGIMVEVPAAAMSARTLLGVADFASIGTNDLTQYTMAADRMQGELAELLSSWQPAVLQMMKMACDGGRAQSKPVGVCGEAGGDPLLALVLTGLGVGSLSMAPPKADAVRAALRLHTLAQCQSIADAAVNAPTAEAAREAVVQMVHPDLLALI